jgi:uncharacterized protein
METNAVIQPHQPHNAPESMQENGAIGGKLRRIPSRDTMASWPRCAVLWVIRFYQNVVSPRTPPSCFFYPTCSHYTYQAIERFGLWRGGWLGVRRLCRCHPLARGGYDPVPENFQFFPRQPADETNIATNTKEEEREKDAAAAEAVRNLDE